MKLNDEEIKTWELLKETKDERFIREIMECAKKIADNNLFKLQIDGLIPHDLDDTKY